jgi:hypothetical protein
MKVEELKDFFDKITRRYQIVEDEGKSLFDLCLVWKQVMSSSEEEEKDIEVKIGFVCYTEGEKHNIKLHPWCEYKDGTIIEMDLSLRFHKKREYFANLKDLLFHYKEIGENDKKEYVEKLVEFKALLEDAEKTKTPYMDVLLGIQ